MKKIYVFLLLVLAYAVSGCQAPDGDIYILYDNDVHCAIEGYEKMAALRAELLEKSLYVNVVSCGDFAQGNAVGCISKGRYPVAIMNKVPYDYVTLGNHEFDYGISQLKTLKWWLRAKCLCCNLTYSPTGSNLFKPYDIRIYGTTHVAFIGVTTPTTLTTSMPTNFQDDKGNVIYDFHADDLINVVQQTVNSAKMEGAEYVIVLSHLGDDDVHGINSIKLIEQTTGINAVLDGHAHHVINTKVANATGDSILLASTGTNFHYAGCLLIAQDHTLHNELIDLSGYEGSNERVASKIKSVQESVANKTSYTVGYSELALMDSDAEGNRLVRMEETNLGDFVSDAFRSLTKSDIGVAIGGGLRSSLPAGDVTYADLLQALPFNNTLCKVRVSGTQLLNNLEIAVSHYPQESGDFMHVSGLRYTFDPSMSDHRVIEAQVWKDTCWMSVDSNAMYTIGGQNYTILCGGSEGLMFHDAEPLMVTNELDVDVVKSYIHVLGDTIRQSQYNEQNNRIRIIQ